MLVDESEIVGQSQGERSAFPHSTLLMLEGCQASCAVGYREATGFFSGVTIFVDGLMADDALMA